MPPNLCHSDVLEARAVEQTPEDCKVCLQWEMHPHFTGTIWCPHHDDRSKKADI